MAAKKRAPSRSAKARDGAGPVEAPIVRFADATAWASWLASHHASSRGIWMKIAKKGAPSRSVTYAEALEPAIAWGWIDGQKKPFDETSWLQKFTPRSRRSIWSKINRDKALALIAAGTMKPPGLSEVERAKRDGRWDAAYDSPSHASIPPDLAAALAASSRAAAFFGALNAQNRYAILFRIHTAKRPETRAKRIAQFVEMLAKHEKIYP